jgi:ParB family chromosome partitioning protein
VIDPQTIGALTKSIARNGLMQPLVVRPLQSPDSEVPQNYEIIAGERRWRAARSAGVDELPVVVRDVGDREALELALVENIQREDLNPIDRAGAYETYCREFGFKPEELGVRLGEDRTTVTNYLRLLELPEEVKDMVARGELGMGHARCILGISDADARLDLARAAVANSLSVRALENIVRRRKAHTGAASSPAPARQVAKPAHLADLENRLQHAVGTKVTIREARRKGQGRIIIEYYSLDDFDRIAGRLGLTEE